MQITADQRNAWRDNPETAEWESFIGPLYKKPDGTADIEELYRTAEANGITDARTKYGSLNAGQIAMNIRNRLRPLWRNGKFRHP
jgi:hypothetical protein